MLQTHTDERAAEAIKSAIGKLFGNAAIENIDVRPGEDHTGGPALFVTIYLKAQQKRMSGSRLLDTIAAATTALREMGDERFPYVTFLAPEDEHAEDTRPAARTS
jgi:hypothetical protein